jgi:hypothetical protein
MPTIFWEFPEPVPAGLAGVGRDFNNVAAAEKWYNEYKTQLISRTLLVSGGNVFKTTPEGFVLAKRCEYPLQGPTGPTGPAAPVK